MLSVLCVNFVNGQDIAKTQATGVVSLNKINVFIPSIGLEREQKMSRFSTLSLGVNYQYAILREYFPYVHYSQGANGYSLVAKGVNVNSRLKTVPGANLNYRYYYNLEKRNARNKSTVNNTGNYVGLDVGAVFPRMFDKSNLYNYQIAITPNWGLQRNENKNVNFEFAVGPSLVFNPYEIMLSIALKLGVSILY